MKKKIFAWALCLCMIWTLVPATAMAAEESTSYVDANGSSMGSVTATVVTASDTTWNEGWYVAKGKVDIGTSAGAGQRVTVNGNVNLILADGCDLTIYGGITVNAGNSITIWGQSTGAGKEQLYADAYHDVPVGNAAFGGAGIGGSDSNSAGNITINGGNVKARGYWGAAIGGGQDGDGGVTTIAGGTVTAELSSNAAGIGGGSTGSGGTIKISGGTVIATGAAGAAAIGGGRGGGASGTIEISGGTITATGGMNAVAIGGGNEGTETGGASTVTISGGEVTATAGGNIASIGGGDGNGDSQLTIKPDAGSHISVEAGSDAGAAMALSGSPFKDETGIASTLGTNKYFHSKAASHSFGDWITTSDTEHWKECITCKAVDSKENHSFGDWITTSDTEHWKECITCKAVHSKANHIWSEWEEEVSATATTDGNEKRTCSTCSKKETRVLPATGYTITFDAGEGEVNAPTVNTDADGKLTQLPVPSRTGYRFVGWFTAAEGGTQITEGAIFSANDTIYAHWTKIEEEKTPIKTTTKPKNTVPQTGDATDMTLWIYVLGASFVIIMVLATVRRRSRKNR